MENNKNYLWKRWMKSMFVRCHKLLLLITASAATIILIETFAEISVSFHFLLSSFFFYSQLFFCHVRICSCFLCHAFDIYNLFYRFSFLCFHLLFWCDSLSLCATFICQVFSHFPHRFLVVILRYAKYNFRFQIEIHILTIKMWFNIASITRACHFADYNTRFEKNCEPPGYVHKGKISLYQSAYTLKYHS